MEHCVAVCEALRSHTSTSGFYQSRPSNLYIRALKTSWFGVASEGFFQLVAARLQVLGGGVGVLCEAGLAVHPGNRCCGLGTIAVVELC